MKIMKKMEASKAKRERQQRRFVSERGESDSQEKVNHIVTAVKKKKKVEVHKQEMSPFRQPGNYKDGVLYVSLKQFDHSSIC